MVSTEKAIIRAIKAAERQAKETGQPCFLYQDLSISCTYREGWLFKASPDGRKVLSAQGVQLMEALK